MEQQLMVADEARREKDRLDELRRKEQDRILEVSGGQGHWRFRLNQDRFMIWS